MISDQMEQYSEVLKAKLMATSKTVVLNYTFGKGDMLDVYQLVLFVEGEAWNVLSNGYLLASLNKVCGNWVPINSGNLDPERIQSIGRFIDSQNFNDLPARIKSHWDDYVHEVIVQNDSAYLIVCKEDINFKLFGIMFYGAIGKMVDVDWPVNFRIYDADFSDEFMMEVSSL